MKNTIQNQICEALKVKGFHEVLPSKSRKYRMFHKGGNNGYYFVGKKGSFRTGDTISKSVSLSGITNKILGIKI
jgi:hypothetical protein